MIKFFRKIRQRLLTENKFSKYLLYAIGEIALVMIGILLALQVNDWNETKKNETIIENNTLLLIENIVADSVYIANRRLAIQTDLEVVHSIKKRATRPNVKIDTLIKIARDEYTAGVSGVNFRNQTVFNTILGSGEINLYNKGLIQEINSIYSAQEMANFQYGDSFQRYVEALRDYRRRYTFNTSTNIVSEGPLFDKLWGTIDEVDFIAKFNAMAGRKILVYHQISFEVDKVQNSINVLLPKLRKILAND